MALQIIWTQEAERQFSEILKYWTERNGSTSYAIKLNRIVEKSLSILTRYPESGRITKKERVRIKLLKNYFIYYRFDNEFLTVIAIFDNRRNATSIEEIL